MKIRSEISVPQMPTMTGASWGAIRERFDSPPIHVAHFRNMALNASQSSLTTLRSYATVAGSTGHLGNVG